MPLISIITPAHNSAATLGAAIASVQAQSMTDWEMIIIDDWSNDGTIALAAHHALQDERLRVIRLAEQGGSVAARNKGLEAATGRYVAFLDADDAWLPEKLHRQIPFMQGYNAALCATAYRRAKAPARTGRLIKGPSYVTFDHLLKGAPVALSTVMIDRDITGPMLFNEQLYGRNDLALWLTLTKTGYDIAFLNEDLARRRANTKSRLFHDAWATWRILRDIAGLQQKAAWQKLLLTATKVLWRRLL